MNTPQNDNRPGYNVATAMDYLRQGGLGETIGLIQMFVDAGHTNMQIDADHAMALAMLAMTGLEAERAANPAAEGEA